MGESAGGISVDDYSRAWACDPIAQGLIAMSGTSTGLGVRNRTEGEDMWKSAATAAGCMPQMTSNNTGNTNINMDNVHECMLGKPAHLIAKGLISVVNSPISIPYGPTIDDEVVFAEASRRYNTTAAVSMLIGNTDNEGGLFRLFTDAPLTDNDWVHQNQESFVCPAAHRATASLEHGNPTWRYRYMGNFKNMELSTQPKSGAYHESEMRQLFNTVKEDFPGTGKSTADEVEFGKYMRSLWAGFAKDPVNGLVNLGWPRYQNNGTTLAKLGFENKAGLHLARGDAYDWGC